MDLSLICELSAPTGSDQERVQRTFWEAVEQIELADRLGYRTVCFRKVDDSYMTFEWDDFALGRSRFDYLPPLHRLVAAVRHRALDRSPLGRRLARRSRRRGQV